MAETQNKFYKTVVNGQTYYEVQPDVGNTPYGYTPITAQEYLSGLKSSLEAKQSQQSAGFDPNGRIPSNYFYNLLPQEIARQQAEYNTALSKYSSVDPNATGAGQSGYEIVNGVPQRVGTEAAKAQEAADIASGKLVQIGTAPGGQPLYGPSGSPAALQSSGQDPRSSTLPEYQQMIKDNPAQFSQPGQPSQTMQLGTPVQLGNGQTVYVDQQGNFKDANGNPVSNSTIASSTAGTQGAGTTGAPSGGQGTVPDAASYGLTGENAKMYDLMKGYLEKLTTNGQSINPNIEITPERVSEFMKQAESNIDQFIPYASKEIKPFYENQLKIAREGFLRSAGYSQQQLVDHEAELEQKFSESQKGIGESAADSGFAQSGMRRFNEQQNIDSTQRALGQARDQVGNQVTGLASQFAQSYGTANLPQMNIGSTPQVGDNSFTRNGSSPFYQLSPETYNGLKGEQEFAQEAAIRSRAAELEGAFRSSLATSQQRTLTT